MYIFFGLLIFLLLFFFLFNHWRKKKIIKKICCMPCEEKCRRMNELVEPFGYAYLPGPDLFTTRIDAWQREFGYCALFDRTAYRFHLIFDCLPVYFNYRGSTWLIEVWKGQYGINTGGELGVYRADRVLERKERRTTLFKSVPDSEMPVLSFKLYRNESLIADPPAVGTVGNNCAGNGHTGNGRTGNGHTGDCCSVDSCIGTGTRSGGRHWWLTAFRMGWFSRPRELSMRVCITFPCREMAERFAGGLLEAGYREEEIGLCCGTVSFCFVRSLQKPGCFRRLYAVYAQWLNRLLCRLYLFVTRPFCTSLDRLLYLYFYLPYSFRRMFRMKKNRKWRRKRRSRG